MDAVTFFIDQDNPNEFGIRIENADRNSHTTFYLKMLDIDESEIRLPDIQLDSVITMPSNDFQRICRDMFNISDQIQISTCKQMLKLSCNGEFASQETLIGEASHGLVFSRHNDEDEVTGKFSLKYINLFTKSTNLSNSLQIYLKKDYPFMLKYNVANLGDIMFCLAPSVA